eukprot:6196532-Pleurochrysis_carterae.AAC.1
MSESSRMKSRAIHHRAKCALTRSSPDQLPESLDEPLRPDHHWKRASGELQQQVRIVLASAHHAGCPHLAVAWPLLRRWGKAVR